MVAAPGVNNVAISWDAVPDAFGYQIKGRVLSSGASGTVISLSHSRTVGGLVPGIAYGWSVRAGCPYDTTAFSVEDTFMTLAPRIAHAEELEVYPSPADRHITVDAPAAGWLRVIDFHGRLVISRAINSGNQVLPIKDLPNGMYEVVLILEGNTKRAAFVKTAR